MSVKQQTGGQSLQLSYNQTQSFVHFYMYQSVSFPDMLHLDSQYQLHSTLEGTENLALLHALQLISSKHLQMDDHSELATLTDCFLRTNQHSLLWRLQQEVEQKSINNGYFLCFEAFELFIFHVETEKFGRVIILWNRTNKLEICTLSEIHYINAKRNQWLWHNQQS